MNKLPTIFVEKYEIERDKRDQLSLDVRLFFYLNIEKHIWLLEDKIKEHVWVQITEYRVDKQRNSFTNIVQIPFNELTNDGNHHYKRDINFDVMGRPNFLKYDLKLRIDLDGLLKQYQISPEYIHVLNGYKEGPITPEIIFKNGKENLVAFEITNPKDGKPWEGEIMMIDDRTVIDPATNLELKVSKTKNFKVQSLQKAKYNAPKTEVHPVNQGKNKNIVSDLKIAFDEDHNAHLLFYVDVKKVFEQKSLLPLLYQDEDFNISDFITIKNLSFSRYRVQESACFNHVGSRIPNKRTHEVDNVPELLLTAGDKSTKSIPNKQPNDWLTFVKDVFVKYYGQCKINEVYIDNFNKNYRIFSIEDNTLKRHTDGEYKYELDITFEDPSVKVLKYFDIILKEDLQNFQLLLNIVSADINVISKISGDFYKKLYSNLASLFYISRVLGKDEVTLEELENLIYFKTISTKTIKFIIEIYNTLCLEISSLIPKEDNLVKTLKIHKKFDNNISMIDHGVVFLEEIEKNKGAITITLENFAKNADNEEQKYFKDKNIEITSNKKVLNPKDTSTRHKYSYFSPKTVRLDRKYTFSKQDNINFNDVMIKSSLKKSKSLYKSQKVKGNKQEKLNDTIKTLRNASNIQTKTKVNKPFLKTQLELDVMLQEEGINVAQTGKKYNIQDKNSLINQIKDINKLPNQIKSLLASQDVKQKDNVQIDWDPDRMNDSEMFSTLLYNHMMINKIEILININDVLDEEWVLLTEDIYKNKLIQGSKVLARLVKYHNSDLDLKIPKMADIPVYYTYFIVDIRDKEEVKDDKKQVFSRDTTYAKVFSENDVFPKTERLLVTLNRDE